MKFQIYPTNPGRALMILECDRKCQIPLRTAGPVQWTPTHHVWGWNGRTDVVTVRPSVNCSVCGFHKTLIDNTWH